MPLKFNANLWNSTTCNCIVQAEENTNQNVPWFGPSFLTVSKRALVPQLHTTSCPADSWLSVCLLKGCTVTKGTRWDSWRVWTPVICCVGLWLESGAIQIRGESPLDCYNSQNLFWQKWAIFTSISLLPQLFLSTSINIFDKEMFLKLSKDSVLKR